mgnify:CR=1 FL=1
MSNFLHTPVLRVVVVSKIFFCTPWLAIDVVCVGVAVVGQLLAFWYFPKSSVIAIHTDFYPT